MATMSIVREPAIPPSVPPPADPKVRREILFRHPGYSDSNNIMLKLFAPDRQDEFYGLYAQLALDACGVIVGNRWDGWLSRFKDSTGAKENSANILQAASYYFHLPDSSPDVPYPVVPNFTKWRFPHNDNEQLPDAWRQLNLGHNPVQNFTRSDFSAAVRIRDLSCRMTGCTVAAQVAHLCPQRELKWIDINAMHQYNQLGEPEPNDTSNMLLLRADLHLEFDNRKFVFVPKPMYHPEDEHEHHSQLVTHVLKPEAELEHLYHNRMLQFSHGIGPSIEWLFARFAWSIFPFLNGFLTTEVRRRLRLYNENGEPTDDYFSSDECIGFSTAPNVPKSHLQSPMKRQRTQVPRENIPDERLEKHDEQEPGLRKRFRYRQDSSSDSNSPSRDRKRHRHFAARSQPFVKLQQTHWPSQLGNRNRDHPFENYSRTWDVDSGSYLPVSGPSSPAPTPTSLTVPPLQDQDTVGSLHDSSQKGMSSESRQARNSVGPFNVGQDQTDLCSVASPHDSAYAFPTINYDHDHDDVHSFLPLKHPAIHPSAAGDSCTHLADHPRSNDNASPSVPKSAVVEAWLARERKRLDPAQLRQWEADREWATEVWNGEITLNRESARKWYELQGVEVMD